MGARCAFFRSGRPKEETRYAVVTLANLNDIVGRLPCLPQGINDDSYPHASLFGQPKSPPLLTSMSPFEQIHQGEERILRGSSRLTGDCAEDSSSGQTKLPGRECWVYMQSGATSIAVSVLCGAS
nr:unnamed protein product [Spirometra erinaceieuropaei]